MGYMQNNKKSCTKYSVDMHILREYPSVMLHESMNPVFYIVFFFKTGIENIETEALVNWLIKR